MRRKKGLGKTERSDWHRQEGRIGGDRKELLA